MAKVEEMRSHDTLVSNISLLIEKMRCIEKEIKKKDNIIIECLKYMNLSEEIIEAVEGLDKELHNNITCIGGKNEVDIVIYYEAVNRNYDTAVSSYGYFVVSAGERM